MLLLDHNKRLEKAALEASPPVAPDLLIEEARRRGRRRRLGWFTLVVIAAGGVIAFAGMRSQALDPKRATAAPGVGGGLVKMLNLSRTGPYDSLALVNGRLVLSGGPERSLFPSASIAATSHSPTAGICHSAVVDPTTLKLSHVTSESCEDPSLYGVRVLPINYVGNGQDFASTIRIAHSNNSPRGFSVGPVIMRYTESSDTDAEWIYGDGYLWIYDPSTTAGSELLQVSLSTGTVIDRVRMPQLARPLLATNEDGLWLVPSLTSGFNGHPSLALYRISPGTRTPVIEGGSALHGHILAHWLVASEHSVWVDVNHYPRPSTIWRFDGVGAEPVYHREGSAALDYIEFGYGESDYGGDNSAVWAVVPGNGQRVIRISADTGVATTVTTVRPSPAYDVQTLQPPLVVLNGDAFFLDPPKQSGTYPYQQHGFSALYRVGT